VFIVNILKGLLSEVRHLEKKLRLLLKTSNFAEPQKSSDSVDEKVVNSEKPNKKNDAKMKINLKPEKKKPQKKRWRKKKIHSNVPSPKVDSPEIPKEIVPSREKVPKWPTIMAKKEKEELIPNPVPSPKNDEKMKKEKEKSNLILANEFRETGNSFYKAKDYQSAQLSYQNAFDLSPDDARICGNLVNCFVAREEFEKAIQLSIEIFKMCRKIESERPYK